MRRNTMMVIVALAALLSTALAAGCDSEDTSSYNVVVSWNVAGAQTCTVYVDADTTLTFDQITVDLYDMDQLSGGKIIAGELPFETVTVADCSLFQTTIQRLERGQYYAYVSAWATDEDGEHLPYYQAGTTISAPSSAGDAGYTVSLMLGKGQVEVTWGFDNYGQCSANGVTTIVVSLAPSEELDCSVGEYLVTDVAWADNYTLTVNGEDAEGDVTWTGAYSENPFTVKPGQTVSAQVILSPVAK